MDSIVLPIKKIIIVPFCFFVMLCITSSQKQKISELEKVDPFPLDMMVKAIKTDNLNALELAIKKSSNINACNIQAKINIFGDLSPLMFAIMYGSKNAVILLLDNGANPNTGNRIVNPLGLAVGYKDIKMLTILLEHGADINYRETQKYTFMEFALSNQKDNMIKYLIKKGAKVPENGIAIYAHGFLKKGNIEIIELLLKHNAKIDAIDGKINAIALYCGNGQIDIVKYLVKKGADINANYFYLSKNDNKKIRIRYPLYNSCFFPGNQGNLVQNFL